MGKNAILKKFKIKGLSFSIAITRHCLFAKPISTVLFSVW